MNIRPGIKVLMIAVLCLIVLALFIPTSPRISKSQFLKARCNSDITDIRTGFEKYLEKYGEYPGSNQLATWKKLSGDNSEKIKFVHLRAFSINTNGEFLDPWGTPYVIRFLPTNGFVISSVGGDKAFNSKDDIIFNSISNGFVKP